MSKEAMKCNKCGYDWSNSGDSAHVCGPVKVSLQEQGEPVAWAMLHDNGDFIDAINPDEHTRIEGEYTHPLYTTPQQRTWVGLTDEEILTMSRYDLEYAALIGEVQRKLKDKNACHP